VTAPLPSTDPAEEMLVVRSELAPFDTSSALVATLLTAAAVEAVVPTDEGNPVEILAPTVVAQLDLLNALLVEEIAAEGLPIPAGTVAPGAADGEVLTRFGTRLLTALLDAGLGGEGPEFLEVGAADGDETLPTLQQFLAGVQEALERLSWGKGADGLAGAREGALTGFAWLRELLDDLRGEPTRPADSPPAEGRGEPGEEASPASPSGEGREAPGAPVRPPTQPPAEETGHAPRDEALPPTFGEGRVSLGLALASALWSGSGWPRRARRTSPSEAGGGTVEGVRPALPRALPSKRPRKPPGSTRTA
jgi:hypothetical protein